MELEREKAKDKWFALFEWKGLCIYLFIYANYVL